jgi:hypothetical protein
MYAAPFAGEPLTSVAQYMLVQKQSKNGSVEPWIASASPKQQLTGAKHCRWYKRQIAAAALRRCPLRMARLDE